MVDHVLRVLHRTDRALVDAVDPRRCVGSPVLVAVHSVPEEQRPDPARRVCRLDAQLRDGVLRTLRVGSADALSPSRSRDHYIDAVAGRCHRSDRASEGHVWQVLYRAHHPGVCARDGPWPRDAPIAALALAQMGFIPGRVGFVHAPHRGSVPVATCRSAVRFRSAGRGSRRVRAGDGTRWARRVVTPHQAPGRCQLLDLSDAFLHHAGRDQGRARARHRRRVARNSGVHRHVHDGRCHRTRCPRGRRKAHEPGGAASSVVTKAPEQLAAPRVSI